MKFIRKDYMTTLKNKIICEFVFDENEKTDMYMSSSEKDEKRQTIRSHTFKLFNEVQPANIAAVVILDSTRKSLPFAAFVDMGVYEVSDILYEVSLIAGDRFIESLAYYYECECIVAELPVVRKMIFPKGVYKRVRVNYYKQYLCNAKTEALFQKILFERLVTHRGQA